MVFSHIDKIYNDSILHKYAEQYAINMQNVND
jgi:hypothetical protein